MKTVQRTVLVRATPKQVYDALVNRKQSAQCLGLIGFLLTPFLAVAQNTHGPANISKTTSNLLVSWSGIGTLQSSPTVAGSWQDVLEAGSPRSIAPTNAQQFFRVISRWSTRADLIEANSEMGVAELNGKIYVLGGYPASRDHREYRAGL